MDISVWRLSPEPSSAGRFSPNRKLIAAGLNEVETAATGKIEKRAVDDATVLAHLGLSRFNICAANST